MARAGRDAQIASAQHLQAAIEELLESSARIQAEVVSLGRKKSSIEEEMTQHHLRLRQIHQELPEKLRTISDLERLCAEKEALYMKLVEATPTLVHVSKR
eukprot:TRINITY_DN5324_c0_g1_i1.p1 TRINITY_DN5324_c0_g1~~TRINITY_DN5324_c0_g1_i1.p1  ORF type:complete len:100 (+),score=29.53 TRINITY_DN5324_c0_g1_i1:106-405(+)